MADPDHLAVLSLGVPAWNLWRSTRSMIWPDLSKADLRGDSTSSESRVRRRAILIRASKIMDERNVRQSHMRGAAIRAACLNWKDLNLANFNGRSFRHANFQAANLQGSNLSGTDLTEANLSGSDLSGARLIHADLRGADLHLARLVRADLRNADLRGVDLTHGADLTDADLRAAELGHADLTGANLEGATLRGASLDRTDFNGARLHGVDFGEARLGWANFSDVDLSGAKGLDRIDHLAPSSIGIDTLFRSQGNIPEVFLRGCGVPEQLIVYARSLIGQAIEFYSCFISYSSHNQAFAERLHADLRAKDLRCWFAPEDLKIGDRFQERIEESIRLFDKVVIVLSEASVQSRWVEREVNAAREREDRDDRTVLFPIRIDDAVMNTSQAWAADVRRSRHIGDFRGWETHSSYQKAFERLLRDLQVQSDYGAPA